MGRDARRTILILDERVELFAAVRPLLESELLQVHWARPTQADEVVPDCVPWPWGVAGRGLGPLPGCVVRLRRQPVLWFWLGGRPSVLPGHARDYPQWRNLADDVRACVSRSVGGVKLAPNRGLMTSEGKLVLSAPLEALVSSTPVPLRLSLRAARSASEAIDKYELPIRLVTAAGHSTVEGFD